MSSGPWPNDPFLLPIFAQAVAYAPAPTGIAATDTANITALIGPSKTIKLQPGTYNLGAGAIGINLDSLANVALEGSSGEWFTNAGTVISYTGTGSAVSARGTGGSADGIVIRNLAINAPNAAMLLDFGTTGAATAAGASNIKAEKVFFNSTNTTNILLNLAQAISSHIEDCAFSGGGVQIQGVTTATGFSNTHNIDTCYFTQATIAPIRNPYNNWLIQGCTFEPMAGVGAAGGILCTGTLGSGGFNFDGLTLMGNSFQDVQAGNGGTWLALRGPARGLTMIGNSISGNAAQHVDLSLGSAAINGVAIIGNVIIGSAGFGVRGFGGETAMVIMANRFASNTSGNVSGTPGFGIVSADDILGQNLYGFTNLRGGGLDIGTAGRGLAVAEGANAKQGTAVLVAGTVTVANTSVTANSRILLTSQVDGGTVGFVRVSARVAGTSFTITSSNAADTSTIAYQIFEPG